MPEKHTLKKLSNSEVDGLKGKLLEVRRISAGPVYIAVNRSDSIEKALEKADIPTDDEELKVEGLLEGSTKWDVLKLTDKAHKYKKLAVTTKVSGA